MGSCAVLLVTCCLESSRLEILNQVVDNLLTQDPTAKEWLTVIDNASTEPGTIATLKRFDHVLQTNHNVGYWSAIDYWLNALALGDQQPEYTYIIESDMIHYEFGALTSCVDFLDKHPELGAVRLHEYSIENMRFYNKDEPIIGSRSNLWQSHTNRVTGEGIVHNQIEGRFWKNNFLTQLPALNRYPTMKRVFDKLNVSRQFTELDFQRFYHEEYKEIAILDGGIFNCDLNPYGSKQITGSWTSPNELKRLGYHSTRFASITPRDQYTVTRLT